MKEGRNQEKKNQSKERNRREQTSPVSIQVDTHLTLTVEETEATMKAAFARKYSGYFIVECAWTLLQVMSTSRMVAHAHL